MYFNTSLNAKNPIQATVDCVSYYKVHLRNCGVKCGDTTDNLSNSIEGRLHQMEWDFAQYISNRQLQLADAHLEDIISLADALDVTGHRQVEVTQRAAQLVYTSLMLADSSSTEHRVAALQIMKQYSSAVQKTNDVLSQLDHGIIP